jgi:hypothetical protein
MEHCQPVTIPKPHIYLFYYFFGDSAVGITKRYGMDGRGSIPAGEIFISILHNIMISFAAHTDFNPVGIGTPLSSGKAAGA